MALQAIQNDCSQIIRDLAPLSNDELSGIVDDDEKISNLLSSLDQSYLTNLEQEKDVINSSIKELSETNLILEPELAEGREQIATLSSEGEELSKIVEEKHKQLRDKGGDMNLETALALLQTGASELEEDSDNIAKKFLDNETELDSFLDEFLTKRKLMHIRLVKAEKLSKIVSRGNYDGNIGTNYMNAPPMNINSNYFPQIPTTNPGTVPYPTGPLAMPMPGSNFFQNHY